MAADLTFPLNPFLNPPLHPLVYYRFERGHLLNIVPDKYFHPVTPVDVFNTFCFTIGGGGNNPVRLVFNDSKNYTIWRWSNPINKGDAYTIIEIQTNVKLPLAEDFIQNVSWSNERNNELIEGCPYLVMQQQGATGKEFVLQPSNIVGMAAYYGLVV